MVLHSPPCLPTGAHPLHTPLCPGCCWYRFSGKPISTYMSLTPARLCGEWWLVGGNYEARGSGRKYEAQIVIFCILAAINRFSRISRKAENRWGNRKAIEENWKAVEESKKLLKKGESRWRKLNFVWGKLDFRRRKILIFPKRFSRIWQFLETRFPYANGSMCAHGFTLAETFLIT